MEGGGRESYILKARCCADVQACMCERCSGYWEHQVFTVHLKHCNYHIMLQAMCCLSFTLFIY